jgi:hypothetical protein
VKSKTMKARETKERKCSTKMRTKSHTSLMNYTLTWTWTVRKTKEKATTVKCTSMMTNK